MSLVILQDIDSKICKVADVTPLQRDVLTLIDDNPETIKAAAKAFNKFPLRILDLDRRVIPRTPKYNGHFGF